MASLQRINLGSYPNDGTGDDLRTAFIKVNTNFTTLFDEGAVVGGTNLGPGSRIFVDKNTETSNLEFKTLVTNGSMTITDQGTSLLLSSITNLQSDTHPRLGGDLNLNGHIISGGDIQTTVFNYDMQIDNNILSIIVSQRGNIDFGTFQNPTGYQRFSKGYPVDFNGPNINGFANPVKNDYDLGSLDTSNSIPVGKNFLTLGSNLTTSGGNITLTASSNINLTLTSGGTVATRESGLGQFASSTSAQLLGAVSDTTGSGRLVFNTSPILSGTVVAGNISAGGYIYCSGNFAVNGTQFEVNSLNGNTTVAGTLTTNTVISKVTPGNYQFDVSSNTSQISLNIGSTVNFGNFSGSVLVNCWNSGTVTQYLCGGGGNPIAVGSSKVTATGTMTSNSGIGGYTFTATETGVHTFYVVRTRPGA
jgi:hypothetical protein